MNKSEELVLFLITRFISKMLIIIKYDTSKFYSAQNERNSFATYYLVIL